MINIRTGITGIKDTDFIILSNLNDRDVVNMCQVNRYSRELCNNENFWMNRTIKRFARFSKSIKQDRVNLNLKWKEFYIKLVNITKYFYNFYNSDFYNIVPNRTNIIEIIFPDTEYSLSMHLFDNIGEIFLSNRFGLSYIIEDEKDLVKLKKFLENDFVNPNYPFYICREKRFCKKLFRILKTHPYFNPKVVLEYTFRKDFCDIEAIVSQIYKLLTWQDILRRLVTSLSRHSGKSYTLIYLKYAVLLGASSNDIKKAFSKDKETISERELKKVNGFIKN